MERAKATPEGETPDGSTGVPDQSMFARVGTETWEVLSVPSSVARRW